MPSSSLTSYETLGGWVLVLAVLSLAPFLLCMITSFVKLVVVASLIRTAMGTPQIPPTIVVTGLAMVLTVHVMWPVADEIATEVTNRWSEGVTISDKEEPVSLDISVSKSIPPAAQPTLAQKLPIIVNSVLGPLQCFLSRHAHPENLLLFEQLRMRLTSKQPADTADKENTIYSSSSEAVRLATILVPAFVLSELSEAFQIGFLIFIPFLIVDLLVSIILMTLGMQYLQPTLVSLPLKLLLFVLLDGWKLIVERLLLGYV